ncbi:hypothetical protein E4T52_08984 [Aureobasidium sp. EXF-3400]|nr:hypothetical protein E4T51_08161 [Aureobasidium sp. EXF-12344]KAI4776090.1 hypothetical protein E4T52_08984 [Aureobasidium sp. EXF-3400]
MPPTNLPSASDQRRPSSTHSSRTTTGHGALPTHTFPKNTGPHLPAGPHFSAGFGFAPSTAQTGPPSYASDPNASPTFSFDNSTGQNCPPVRPQLEHMIVSVNRQKQFSSDMQWTTQFPLENLRSSNDIAISISDLSFSRLLGEISENLLNQVQEQGLSVVWVMSVIDQLGVVSDNGSLKAAVLDHQNAAKHTIQLYVVRETAEGTVLPESQVISSKTFILPKVPSTSSILSPDMAQQENTPRQPNFANGFGR